VQASAEFITKHRLTGEVIVVDDGSSDETSTLAREVVIPSEVQRTVIRDDIHRGKGFAIRTGILASQAEYVMFTDSGLTVPFENALKGLRLLQEGTCELAHGSRRLPGSVIRKDQDWDRKIISRLFHEVVVRWMRLPRHLTDTQCGFKLYRADIARRLYAECLTEGFMFDIEIIIRAVNHGYRIVEFPVEWTCDRDTRISIRRSSCQIFKEARRIKRALFKPENQHQT
jgi:dolichyl-phosphate beta-glucosyltransferase